MDKKGTITITAGRVDPNYVRKSWVAPEELLFPIPDLPKNNASPATDRQMGAMRTIGLVDIPLTAAQANLLLSTRDYATLLMEQSPRRFRHWKRALFRLIGVLVTDPDIQDYIPRWNRETRDDESRTAPTNTPHYEKAVTYLHQIVAEECDPV